MTPSHWKPSDCLGTVWRDEHGHLYRVVGTRSEDGEVQEVTLTWVAPPRCQKMSYRQLKARMLAVTEERAT